MTTKFTGPFYGDIWPRTVVADGDAQVFLMPRVPSTLVLVIAAGSTAQVAISASSLASIRGEPGEPAPIWIAIDTLTQSSSISFLSKVSAIRVQASGGYVVMEMMQ